MPAAPTVLILALAAGPPGGSAPDVARETASEVAPPNVVVIFCDDLGYRDLGGFGSPDIATPHLDALAAGGTKFTHFYAAQAACSASRAALLTGCYPNRVGISGALGPGSEIGLNPDELTLAELCKRKNYATAIYGKWHLGNADGFWPTDHGFDDWFGLPYSNDMWPLHPKYADFKTARANRKRGYPPLPLYETENGRPAVKIAAVDRPDQALLTTWYTERAVDFIEREKDGPFFLYVPHSMPHVPITSPKSSPANRAGGCTAT